MSSLHICMTLELLFCHITWHVYNANLLWVGSCHCLAQTGVTSHYSYWDCPKQAHARTIGCWVRPSMPFRLPLSSLYNLAALVFCNKFWMVTYQKKKKNKFWMVVHVIQFQNNIVVSIQHAPLSRGVIEAIIVVVIMTLLI